MANQASISYPTLVPEPAIGGGVGLPAARAVVPWQRHVSDQTITGAAKLNPAFASDFLVGRWKVQHPVGGTNEPPEVKSRPVSQALATSNAPNAWKKRTLDSTSNQVRFGGNKPQKPFLHPWNKKLIPPLALFNDASQWVNTLLLNRPMQRSGNGNSDPNVTGHYLGSFPTPAVNVNNFAAGTLNAQLQLGIIAIQAAQLTTQASNYFGGA